MQAKKWGQQDSAVTVFAKYQILCHVIRLLWQCHPFSKVKYGPMGPGGNSGEEVLPGLLPCCFLRVCAGPPCTRTSWDWVSRSLCSWVQSLVRGGLVNQAPNHPARGRTAEAVGWLWIHWVLISCVWRKLLFSSSGFFTEQGPTRAPGRGHSSSHSFRLYQFLESLRFPGDFALGMMQTCGQGPVLPFAVLMCEQKTTASWCSFCPRGQVFWCFL